MIKSRGESFTMPSVLLHLSQIHPLNCPLAWQWSKTILRPGSAHTSQASGFGRPAKATLLSDALLRAKIYLTYQSIPEIINSWKRISL